MATTNLEQFNLEDVSAALERAYGVVLGAASILKCAPRTVYYYLERYPEELEAARERGRRLRVDRAEIALDQMVRGDDPYFPAVRFTLEGSEEGRKRKWGTRPLIQVEQDNRELQVNIEKLMVATGAETESRVLGRLAGLLESGEVVVGEDETVTE